VNGDPVARGSKISRCLALSLEAQIWADLHGEPLVDVLRFSRAGSGSHPPPSAATLVSEQPQWYLSRVTFTIELEREDDGRWLAEVPDLSGVMCYGADRDEALARVQALALRVIADRLEHREAPAAFVNVTFQAA
jgi:predicted RNase H-like HicB family nuclease